MPDMILVLNAFACALIGASLGAMIFGQIGHPWLGLIVGAAIGGAIGMAA